MDFGVSIPATILLIVLGQTTQARRSTDRTSLHFSLLDLDGFAITAPISVVPAISASHCVLICLQTTGCTSVAMSDDMCIAFDGAVILDAHAVYDTAFDSRDMSQRCPNPLPVTTNVKVRHVYPFPNGYATLTCTPGYVGQRAILMADVNCAWIGQEPSCHKSYEWMNNSYYFNPMGMTWKASKEECESYGGWLADIHSQAENDFLVQTLGQLSGPPPHNDAFWIGGTRDGDGKPFSWYHSNQTLDFRNFYGNEPQDGLNEHCLGMFNYTNWHYAWGNARCNRPQGHLCKIPIN